MDGKLNYVVNEEKGTIVAWKDDLRYELHNKVVKKFLSNRVTDIEYCDIFYDFFRLPDKIAVKVKVREGDEFDATKGIKIARAKWRRKYHHECMKGLANGIKFLQRCENLLSVLNQDSVDKFVSYDEEYRSY